ncbi:hypothetical protein IJU97_03435 [bacterium]|nr:hypothetical protein [bacterium]
MKKLQHKQVLIEVTSLLLLLLVVEKRMETVVNQKIQMNQIIQTEINGKIEMWNPERLNDESEIQHDEQVLEQIHEHELAERQTQRIDGLHEDDINNNKSTLNVWIFIISFF